MTHETTNGRLTASQRARREAILAATIELLSAREHGQIHMREIADRSGVALATLYRYFVSKELLYAHAVVAWGRTFGPSAKVQAEKARSDAERIERAICRTIKAYERWPEFYRLIAALEVTEDIEARQVFQRFSAQYRETLCAVMIDTDPGDAEMVTQMLLSTLGEALRKWSIGNIHIRQVYEHIGKATALIFGQPRKVSERQQA